MFSKSAKTRWKTQTLQSLFNREIQNLQRSGNRTAAEGMPSTAVFFCSASIALKSESGYAISFHCPHFALSRTASQTFWVSNASRKVGLQGFPDSMLAMKSAT
jgi:hypothetical protein